MRVKTGSMENVFSQWEQVRRQCPMGMPVSVISNLLLSTERMIDDAEGPATAGRMLEVRRARIRAVAYDMPVPRARLSKAVEEAWGSEWVSKLNLGDTPSFPDPMVETLPAGGIGKKMTEIIRSVIRDEDEPSNKGGLN